MKVIVNSLKMCNIFKDKSTSEIIEFFFDINYSIKTYNKNEIIFNMGETINSIGIIIEGEIKVNKIIENGRIVGIKKKPVGEIIGFCSMYPDIQKFSSFIFSNTKSKIIFIKKIHFLKLLSKDEIILNNYLHILGKQTAYLNKKLELFSYSGIRERIAFHILNFLINSDNKIFIPYSKKEWAEYLNVSRTSFFRELKKMSEEIIIEIKGNNIEILDLDKLKEIISN